MSLNFTSYERLGLVDVHLSVACEGFMVAVFTGAGKGDCRCTCACVVWYVSTMILFLFII